MTAGCCPGLFHGRIPCELPVRCDTVHFWLGLFAGAIRPLRRCGVVLFVLYQAVEELPGRHIRSFFKDVGIFLVGFVLGLGVDRLRMHG